MSDELNNAHAIMCGPDGCVCKPISADLAASILEAARREKAERAQRYPDEASAIRATFDGWARLKEMGWKEAIDAPRDGSPLEAIEVGSTGIHSAHRDKEGRFWIDGEWPSRPALYRPALTSSAPGQQRNPSGE